MRDVTRRGFLRGLVAVATLAAAETTGLGAVTRLRVADDPQVVAGDILHESQYSPERMATIHSWTARSPCGTRYDYYAILLDEARYRDADELERIIDFHEQDAIWKLNDMRRRYA